MEKNFKNRDKNYKKNQKNNENIEKNLNFIKENEINFKKSLGQNFLFDYNLLNAIVKDGLVSGEDIVLEIGAGAGTLTSALCKVAKKVISFEIDNSLIPVLKDVEKDNSNVEFHFQDFKQAKIDDLNFDKARVVANIPYYITTPIVFKLVEKIEKFKSILVLVQKEVAERFASPFGTKEYGITSVILQSIFDVSIPRIVKKECFVPSPKVDSALCLFVPHNKFSISNFEEFKKFVQQSFSMRRKTFVNNQKNFYEKDKLIRVLQSYGYNENVRPEQISVENFINIFNLLKK